jgi:hypothetical protein
MGLYDEFDIKVRCPKCGRKVLVGFQTKALLNLLLYYEVGDKVETERFIVKDGLITDALGSCPECRTLLTCEVIIKDMVFQGVQNVQVWQEKEISPESVEALKKMRSLLKLPPYKLKKRLKQI